jgi:oligoendopeptidase F
MKSIQIAAVSLVFSLLSVSQTRAQEIKTSGRDTIDTRYKWDVTQVYPSEQHWEADFQWVESNLGGYEQYEGQLGTSPEILSICLEFDAEINIKLARLDLYAMLCYWIDMRDTKYQSMAERVSYLKTKGEVAGAFIRPEVMTMPYSQLAAFMAADSSLAVYRHMFENWRRLAEHTLPPDQEEILGHASALTAFPGKTYSLMVATDLDFPVVKDDKGNDVRMAGAAQWTALSSTDAAYRKRATEAHLAPFIAQRNTFATLLLGNTQANIFRATVRGYASAREAVLSVDNIPLAVYDNLLQSVNNNLTPIRRWLKLKKRVMGVDTLYPCDTYATLFPSQEKQYSFEEAREIILAALAPLGEEYVADARTAFDERWIDVYPSEGKHGGGHASDPVYGVHPYILMNWHGTPAQLSTLAHEFGHCMYTYYTIAHQPFVYIGHTPFVSEVTALTNQILLDEYMIDHARTDEEKMALIEQYLENIKLRFYTATYAAEFELAVYQRTEEGQALTADDLSGLWGDLVEKYWGDEVTITEEERHLWVTFPHFYAYNYYVFSYATGLAAAQQIVVNIYREGQPAVDRYLAMLRAGGSAYPVDALREVGVDMTSPEPIVAVTDKMNTLLIQLERMLAKLK